MERSILPAGSYSVLAHDHKLTTADLPVVGELTVTVREQGMFRRDNGPGYAPGADGMVGIIGGLWEELGTIGDGPNRCTFGLGWSGALTLHRAGFHTVVIPFEDWALPLVRLVATMDAATNGRTDAPTDV